MSPRRGGSAGPSYAELQKQEHDRAVNQAAYDVRDGVGFADGVGSEDFDTLDGAMDLIENVLPGAEGGREAGQVQRRLLRIHYA